MDLSIIFISVAFVVKNSFFMVHLPVKCKTKRFVQSKDKYFGRCMPEALAAQNCKSIKTQALPSMLRV